MQPSGSNKKVVSPTKALGFSGTAFYGGYPVEVETNRALVGENKYRTYSKLITDCSIVAASMRYFLALIAKARWSFIPSQETNGEQIAKACEKSLISDPVTSWARIVKRAAMHRFLGFSIQEWTAARNEDGITFHDIAPRAQKTIEKWDVLEDGTVLGVIQSSPWDSREVYLPISKLLYVCDDTLHDSPLGLGVLRHVVKPFTTLTEIEKLEVTAFRNDLNGVPIGRVPITDLERDNVPQDVQRQLVQPIKDFVNPYKTSGPKALILDSAVYRTNDDKEDPSDIYKYSIEMLKTESANVETVANAIRRINQEIARILGTEGIVLGDSATGSFALAKDKSRQFSMQIDATLNEIGESVQRQLIKSWGRLNGIPEKALPKVKPEAVQFRDVEEITSAIDNLARSGAQITPSDPVVNEVRAVLGMPPVPEGEVNNGNDNNLDIDL